MTTKKQVILYFTTPEKYNHAIDMLLCLNIAFNGLRQKYIIISQKAFRKNEYLDLYTNCDNLFSSVI